MSMQETVDMFVDEILEEHLRRLRAESEECQDINRHHASGTSIIHFN